MSEDEGEIQFLGTRQTSSNGERDLQFCFTIFSDGAAAQTDVVRDALVPNPRSSKTICCVVCREEKGANAFLRFTKCKCAPPPTVCKNCFMNWEKYHQKSTCVYCKEHVSALSNLVLVECKFCHKAFHPDDPKRIHHACPSVAHRILHQKIRCKTCSKVMLFSKFNLHKCN